MNPITIVIGVAAISYGFYTAWARRARPEQFKKLQPMKDSLGEAGGQFVHIIGYTVVPIIVGIVLILSGLRAAS